MSRGEIIYGSETVGFVSNSDANRYLSEWANRRNRGCARDGWRRDVFIIKFVFLVVRNGF